MKHMEELKEMLCAELDKIAAKGVISAGDLDAVEKLTHSIKSLSTIEAMDGYSQYDGYSMRGNSYRYSDGRYSRDGRMSDGRSYGYSRDTDRMVEHLHDMMEDAPDSRTKNAIREAIRSIEK